MSLVAESSDVGVVDRTVSHRVQRESKPDTAPAKRRPGKPLQEKDPWQGGVDWGTVIWFAIVHAGALAAPFVFTWKALGLFVGLYWLTGGIGICLGYHRLLTHGSFQTYRPVRWLIAFI